MVGESCRLLVSRNISEIISSLEESVLVTTSNSGKKKKIKKLINLFHTAREKYKEIEFFIEYYSPFESKFFINGPLVPKIELEISSIPFPPQGFQVIEEALFDEEKNNLELLQKEYGLLISKFKFLQEYYTTLSMEESKIKDALKLQLIRIMTLTLNGYDCTINKEATTECSFAIHGIEKMLSVYGKMELTEKQRKSYRSLCKSLSRSQKKLSGHSDSDSFDRLNFMTDYLNHAYHDLVVFFDELNVRDSPLNYAVNLKANSFFQANSINRQYFSVYVTDSSRLPEQASLGKLLFYDPVLSGNNLRACVSCHQHTKAYTDGIDKSLDFDRTSRLSRNAPTLINASYQKLFFHDGRLFNLEEQANEVFNNAHEMNSSEKQVVSKLKESEEYRKLFFSAFENTQDSAITPYAVLKCISEFIKTLDARNSRFDKYLRGDKTKLTKDEVNGYNLFSGKALCGSCHFFPLFNGTVPPMYNDNEFEVIGTPQKPDNKSLDPDHGRGAVTRSDIHDHAFKTPSLRNIEFTAPYMHNGVYDNLDSVLVFYNRGGGAGIGLKVENQTLPFDSLGLSKKELNDIKLFLLTLSDTVGLPKPPQRLPAFKDQSLNKRKTGGQY